MDRRLPAVKEEVSLRQERGALLYGLAPSKHLTHPVRGRAVVFPPPPRVPYAELLVQLPLDVD